MTHAVSRLRILAALQACAIQHGVLQPDGRRAAGCRVGPVAEEVAAVLEQCRAEILGGPAFTVFCREKSGEGTIYISSTHAATAAEAAAEVLVACAEAWSMEAEEIDVIGIIEGDVNVLEWSDEPGAGGVDFDALGLIVNRAPPLVVAAANDAEPAPLTRLLIQEGGSSAEIHLAAVAGDAEAEAFRSSCSSAGYRTSPPVRLSSTLAQQFEQDPRLAVLLTDVAKAARLIDYPTSET